MIFRRRKIKKLPDNSNLVILLCLYNLILFLKVGCLWIVGVSTVYMHFNKHLSLFEKMKIYL